MSRTFIPYLALERVVINLAQFCSKLNTIAAVPSLKLNRILKLAEAKLSAKLSGSDGMNTLTAKTSAQVRAKSVRFTNGTLRSESE